MPTPFFCLAALALQDAEVAPAHFVGARPPRDAVHLQPDEPARVGFVNLVVGQVGDLDAVHPGLDARPLGQDAVLVPAAVLKDGVVRSGLVRFGGKPAEAGGLAVDVARVARPGHDLDLRPPHAALFRLTLQPFGLEGTDLAAAVERVVHFDLEEELEVAELAVGAEEGVGTALGGAPHNRAVLHGVGGGAVQLRPPVQGPPVEEADGGGGGRCGQEQGANHAVGIPGVKDFNCLRIAPLRSACRHLFRVLKVNSATSTGGTCTSPSAKGTLPLRQRPRRVLFPHGDGQGWIED